MKNQISDVADNLGKLPWKAEKKDKDRKDGAIVDIMAVLEERAGHLAPRQKLKDRLKKTPSFLPEPMESRHLDNSCLIH